MFFAHDIASWLGIPAGVVIAAMIILRRKGMQLRARRKQQHANGQLASGPGPRRP
jgi:3-methyladenine DNA glycosylase Mpg